MRTGITTRGCTRGYNRRETSLGHARGSAVSSYSFPLRSLIIELHRDTITYSPRSKVRPLAAFSDSMLEREI